MDLLARYFTVAIFAVILYFIISFVMAQITSSISLGSVAPNVKYYLCRFGIFQAVNIYVSLLVASWFTNKLLGYLS